MLRLCWPTLSFQAITASLRLSVSALAFALGRAPGWARAERASLQLGRPSLPKLPMRFDGLLVAGHGAIYVSSRHLI